jgi:hypothetical protein
MSKLCRRIDRLAANHIQRSQAVQCMIRPVSSKFCKTHKIINMFVRRLNKAPTYADIPLRLIRSLYLVHLPEPAATSVTAAPTRRKLRVCHSNVKKHNFDSLG